MNLKEIIEKALDQIDTNDLEGAITTLLEYEVVCEWVPYVKGMNLEDGCSIAWKEKSDTIQGITLCMGNMDYLHATEICVLPEIPFRDYTGNGEKPTDIKSEYIDVEFRDGVRMTAKVDDPTTDWERRQDDELRDIMKYRETLNYEG